MNSLRNEVMFKDLFLTVFTTIFLVTIFFAFSLLGIVNTQSFAQQLVFYCFGMVIMKRWGFGIFQSFLKIKSSLPGVDNNEAG